MVRLVLTMKIGKDISEMSELKSYYVDFEKGYDVGDLYEHKGKEYEVVAIEAFNNLMLVVEIEYE